MSNKSKTRIQVTLSEPVIQMIDKYCDVMGITRSAYCAQIIGQSVITTSNVLSELTSKLNEEAADSIFQLKK